jgi:hypothetical protein
VARFLSVRTRALLLLGAVALVSTGCVAEVTFSGTKEVTGEESTGPFVVRITCPEALPEETQDLTFAGPGTETSAAFVIDNETTCTISEIEQAGAASVTYECGEIDVILNGESFGGGGPGMSAARGIDEDVTCTAGEEDITVNVNEAVLATVNFTVTNDFPVAPTTTTTTTPPAPTVAPAEGAATPVPAAPTFTG